MSIARDGTAGASTATSALIAGGSDIENNRLNLVEAFDTSFVRTTLDPLNAARYDLGGVSLNGKAIFAGGRVDGSVESSYGRTVDVYDESLTHTIAEDLSLGVRNVGATALPGYAIINGIYAYGANENLVVDAYSSSLTLSQPDPLNYVANSRLAFTSFGNYAFVRGEVYANVYTVE